MPSSDPIISILVLLPPFGSLLVAENDFDFRPVSIVIPSYVLYDHVIEVAIIEEVSNVDDAVFFWGLPFGLDCCLLYLGVAKLLRLILIKELILVENDILVRNFSCLINISYENGLLGGPLRILLLRSGDTHRMIRVPLAHLGYVPDNVQVLAHACIGLVDLEAYEHFA